MNYPGSTARLSLSAIFSLFSLAGTAQVTPALVDFDAYQKLVAEVKQHRQSRLVDAKQFEAMSKDDKVIILDTRSDSMYAAVHVKGAIHLNFSDFTQDNLAKIIPSDDYKILIYCNNNFISAPLIVSTADRDYGKYFATKMAWPAGSGPGSFLSERKEPQQNAASLPAKFAAGSSVTNKPLTLALNIPTYINLYGYGYRNIYELSELVNTYGNKLEFEGTAVVKQK